MTGLQRYLADLDSWVRHELSLPDAGAPRSRGAGAPPTFEVMNELGIPVAELFSIVLHDPSPSGSTAQSALLKRDCNVRRTA